MTAFESTDNRDPADIEREIRQTQAEMGRTADKLGDQLTPKNLLNSLFDKADENGVDARYLLDGARRNPIALAMIALGGIWLVSDSDAKASSLSKLKPSGLGDDMSYDTSGSDDTFHRGYVDHMSRYEPTIGEDDAAYRRRRDLGRASYLMIEQNHDEDDHSFRSRLDQATDALREKRDSWLQSAKDLGGSARDTAGQMGQSSRDTAGRLTTGAQDYYRDNPFVGGAIAAVVGAIAGAAVPASRFEEEQIGPMGAQALDVAKGKARDLTEMAREKKDEIVDRVSDAATTS